MKTQTNQLFELIEYLQACPIFVVTVDSSETSEEQAETDCEANGDTTAKKEIHYDDLDRQTASVISAKTGEETVQILNTTYAYNDTVNFGTSNQVSVLQNKANGYSSTIAYEYDNNGNITKAGDISHNYDEAGQLTRVNDPQYGTTVYVYDVGGNIKYVKSYDYTMGELGNCTGTVTYGYTDEWKDLLTSYNGQSITYDGAGNPLSYRDGMQFTWEMGRQLKTATHNGATYSYKYDTDGLRTEKTDGDITTEYTWADDQLTYQDDGTNEIYFRYDDSGEVIAFNLNGTDYYYAKNLQGDIIAILDGNGECMVKYTYDAWGKVLNVEDNSNINLGTINPLRYRGYYYDTETELYYLQSRYYDATVGRFVNADDVGYLGATGTISSYNLFSYSENNFVCYIDTTGQYVTQIITAAIGALIGATTYIVGYLIEKYCLKISTKFNVWALVGSMAIGALDGLLSYAKIPKLLNFVISFTLEFMSSKLSGDAIFETILCAFVVAIISIGSSGGLSLKKITKYNKQLINKLKKNNWKIVKSGIKAFYKQIKKHIKKYISNSFLSSVFGIGAHSFSKATIKRYRIY